MGGKGVARGPWKTAPPKEERGRISQENKQNESASSSSLTGSNLYDYYLCGFTSLSNKFSPWSLGSLVS